MPATFYQFRERTGTALLLILAFAVFAFGATGPRAWAAVGVATFAVGLAWAWRLARESAPFVSTWFYAAAALPLVAGLLQLLLGTSVRPHSTWDATLHWVVYLAFFALCVNVMADNWLRRMLLSRLAWIGLAVALLGVVQKVLLDNLTYGVWFTPGGFAYASFADREHFAVLIELIFPPTLVLALRESERKLLRFGACLAMAGSLLVSGSWMGVVIVAVEFGVISIAQTYVAATGLRRKGARTDLRVLVSVGGMAVLGLALAASIVLRRSEVNLEAFDRSGESLSRIAVVRQSLRLAVERPLLGYGLDTFDVVFAASKPREDGMRWTHPGSEPVEWLVEAGAFGLASQFLLALLLVAGRKNLRTWVSSVLPVTAAWAHSWTGFPFSTPAVMLTALLVLAQAPVSSGRTASRERRRRRRSSQAATSRQAHAASAEPVERESPVASRQR